MCVRFDSKVSTFKLGKFYAEHERSRYEPAPSLIVLWWRWLTDRHIFDIFWVDRWNIEVGIRPDSPDKNHVWHRHNPKSKSVVGAIHFLGLLGIYYELCYDLRRNMPGHWK